MQRRAALIWGSRTCGTPPRYAMLLVWVCESNPTEYCNMYATDLKNKNDNFT